MNSVPNVWDDDDWVSQADTAKARQSPPQPSLNKQQRMQQHAEANRKLWESAESPETFHYIEANTGGVPLATTNFKPQVKVLSRKPFIAKRDPVAGMSKLAIDDAEEGEAEEDLRAQRGQLTPEEVRAKQKREREEKQKRYDEARAKIFGESAPSSRGSSPGPARAVTPPRSDPRAAAQASRGGRGRGGGHRSSSSSTNNLNGRGNNEGRRSARELYDPNSSPRTESASRGRGGGASGDTSPGGRTPSQDHQQQYHAIRSPRGPDSSGRGGFGLARRGAKEPPSSS